MMLNRRLFLGGSASIAVMAALAACSKTSDSGDGSGATKTGDASVNAQDRGSLKQGGELKFSMSQTIPNWNKNTVEGNLVDAQNIAYWVNPFWIKWDKKGAASPRPEFWKSLKAEDKGGKTVVTMEINEKVVWGNGRKADADDIVESLSHYLDEKYNWASTDGADQIEKVEKTGERTATLTFKSVFPDWSNMVVQVYPKELMADADTFNTALAGEGNFGDNKFFAGPFKVKAWDKAKQVVTLEPNDKWWGDKPLLDTVTFTVLSDDAATASAFANKSLDVVDFILSKEQYDQCAGREDAEVRKDFGLQWRHFTINGKAGVLADKTVRQALLIGTNREAIAKSDLTGLPVEVDKLLLGNHFFMPSQKGYEDNSKDFSYDAEKAKKMLEDLGWKAGSDGIREKDGKRLSAAITIPNGASATENEAKLLQAQMKEIGFEITFANVESDKYFTDYIIPGNYEITAFTWQGTQYPLANIGQIYGTGSDSNFTGLSVPEIDEYITKIATEDDEKKRTELANECDKLIWENVMNFPIYEREQLTAVPKNLANFGAQGLASFDAENVGYVKG